MHTVTYTIQMTINSGLMFHEVLHGLVAIPLAIIIWYKYKSVKLVLIYYLIVYLMDADHLLDYWNYWGVGFNLINFLSLDYYKFRRIAYIPFHAWEWIFVMYYFYSNNKQRKYAFITMLALTSHLLLDSLNVGSLLFYSIFYRALNGFVILH